VQGPDESGPTPYIHTYIHHFVMMWYYFCEGLTFTSVISVFCCWWCPCFVLKSCSGAGYFSADGQSVSSSWYRAPPFGAHDQIFISVGHLRSSSCVAPSLTRRRVCNLFVQFSVTLQSKSRRTNDCILLSHLRLPQPGGPDLCIYIPRNRGAQL
jgi:hypothetical protein